LTVKETENKSDRTMGRLFSSDEEMIWFVLGMIVFALGLLFAFIVWSAGSTINV
jgi:hypothetical protein